MADLQTAHTAELAAATLAAARALLYDVFDDMIDQDWEHAPGGVHALVWEGADLVGHASVIQQRLLHGGRALRTGYVEGVGVRADRRGRGHGAAMMDALETVVRDAYELGALGAADEAAAFYSARGWMLWRGPTSALTPSGIRRTEEDDGCIMSCQCRSRWEQVASRLVGSWPSGQIQQFFASYSPAGDRPYWVRPGAGGGGLLCGSAGGADRYWVSRGPVTAASCLAAAGPSAKEQNAAGAAVAPAPRRHIRRRTVRRALPAHPRQAGERRNARTASTRR